MDSLEQLDVFRSTSPDEIHRVIKELANMIVRLWSSMKIHADQDMFLLTGKRLCYFLLLKIIEGQLRE